MAYPVAYRGGSGARAAAAAIPRGFQPLGRGLPLSPWFKGGLRVAGRFAGAAGLAITAVEFYRWWAGSGGWAPSGFYQRKTCFVAPIKLVTSTGVTGWSSISEAFKDTCLFNQGTLGTSLATPIGAATKHVAMLRDYGPYLPSFPAIHSRYTATIWSRAAAGAQTWKPSVVPPVWLPAQYVGPTVHPMAVPVGQPVARPVAPPVAWPYGKPKTPAYPEDSVGGQPAWAAPRPYAPGIVVTPTGTRPTTVPDIRAVSAVGTKEQKLRLNKGIGTFVHLFNQATEFGDLVDNLYKSLKKDSPCKAKGPVNAAFKADAVYRCFGDIDWDDAIFNILWNDVEDRIWAMVGLPTKPADLPYGTNAPVNIALSKVLGQPVSDGLKAVEAATRTLMERMTGLDLSGKSPKR